MQANAASLRLLTMTAATRPGLRHSFSVISASAIVRPEPSACRITGLNSISAIRSACASAASDSRAISVGDRRQVDRLAAAEPGQQRRRPQRADHAFRFCGIDGRRAVRHVAEQFDRDAAKSHHHHRPERCVVHHANDQLVALRRHALHHHAVDRRVRLVRQHVAHHRIVSVPHRCSRPPGRAARRRPRSCAADRATGFSARPEIPSLRLHPRLPPRSSPAPRRDGGRNAASALLGGIFRQHARQAGRDRRHVCGSRQRRDRRAPMLRHNPQACPARRRHCAGRCARTARIPRHSARPNADWAAYRSTPSSACRTAPPTARTRSASSDTRVSLVSDVISTSMSISSLSASCSIALITAGAGVRSLRGDIDRIARRAIGRHQRPQRRLHRGATAAERSAPAPTACPPSTRRRHPTA